MIFWHPAQRGLSPLLGLTPAGIRALCAEEPVYVPPDGRINVAGVSDANVDRVADAVLRVLER